VSRWRGGSSLEGVLQRYGPLGYFMFAWIPLFPSRQLDREIADGSALDVATMDVEPRGLPGEAVEQHVTAPTTHNVELAQLFPRDLGQIAKDLRVTSSQTVQDQVGEGWSVSWLFIQWIETCPQPLLVDAGRHIAGKHQVFLIYLKKMVRGR